MGLDLSPAEADTRLGSFFQSPCKEIEIDRVCVWERETERDKEREGEKEIERKKEIDRDGEREREREREREDFFLRFSYTNQNNRFLVHVTMRMRIDLSNTGL